MVDAFDTDFDEDAAMDALWHSLGRDAAKREHQRKLKGYLRDVALEKRGPDIEEMIARDLQTKESHEPRGQVLEMVRHKENQSK
jgi:hypothetical protein